MFMIPHSLHDTIIALATPSGMSALAIIRLSGDRAIAILREIFSGNRPVDERRPDRYVGYLEVADGASENSARIDQVVIHVFPAGASYTGEEMVEINCHGSTYVISEILRIALEKGARMAEAGEFTKRAYMNGKMDLLQAEAVADLIQAQSKTSLQQALRQLDGNLSRNFQAIKERLTHQCALLELELDFSDDEQFVDRQHLQDDMCVLKTDIEHLISTFDYGREVRDGAHIVIAGRPNVGKSSLLNRLLVQERAIVTSHPGTTRDSIEETMRVQGWLFKITDTAGIRDHASEIEQLGVVRTKALVEKADLVLWVMDASQEIEDEDIKRLQELNLSTSQELIYIINKSDLERKLDTCKLHQPIEPENLIPVSCKTGAGLEELRDRLKRYMESRAPAKEAGIITRVRHRNLLLQVTQHLNRAIESVHAQLSGEFVVFDLRRALDSIGEIVGEVSSEDILEEIFAQFCIGK